MAVLGLLAVLSFARIASAGEGPAPVPAPATPGIADEVSVIVDALSGRDRGDAVSGAAHAQADSVGRDSTSHGGGSTPAPAPAPAPGDGGGKK